MRLPRLLFGNTHPQYHFLMLGLAVYVAWKVRKIAKVL